MPVLITCVKPRKGDKILSNSYLIITIDIIKYQILKQNYQHCHQVWLCCKKMCDPIWKSIKRFQLIVLPKSTEIMHTLGYNKKKIGCLHVFDNLLLILRHQNFWCRYFNLATPLVSSACWAIGNLINWRALGALLQLNSLLLGHEI